MRNLMARQKATISRSDVVASVIISVFEFDPEPSNSRSYSREAEILIEVPTRRDVHEVAKNIVRMLNNKKIQIIASDVN